jgi:two-component system sensor histidine kinase VicK
MKVPFSLRKAFRFRSRIFGSELRAILEEFPAAMILRDEDGKILFLNKRAEELFSVRRADVLAQTMLAKDLETLPPNLRKALELTIPEGKSVKVVLSDDEGERTYVATETPIMLEGGLRAALRIFRETSYDERTSELKTRFLSIAAHQLRVPISGIKWVLDMFVKGEVGPLTDEQRDLLVRAQETAERMIRLINDLLDVTRIEEGRFGYRFSKEPKFGEFLREVADRFRDRAIAKGITLELNLPHEPLPPLLIDETRLSLALENIIANAINYTPRGTVRIIVERRNDDVAIIVRDTGIGIPKGELEKLFTKFYRATNVQKLGYEGTGLGLFIARSIIRRHGGDITIDSTEGKGTTVTMTIPIDPQRIPTTETSFGEDAV